MKDGNWIAIDKNLAKHFSDKKYSEIEAAFSLTLDYDNNKNVTVSGYAKLWQWSRSKVRRFLDCMGIEIIYPEDTIKNQKQKGQIKRQKKDRSETEKGQIRMIDTKCLEMLKNRKRTDQRQKKDRSEDTTSKPINNPKPNTKLNKIEKPENVTDQTWNDFLTHRKNKKANVTQTVINGFKEQADLAYFTLENAFKESIERGWTGFKAEWVKDKNHTVSDHNNKFFRDLQKKGFKNGTTITNDEPF